MKAGRILIPLDGSKTAEAAIPEAVAMARGRPCIFVLLCVAEAKTPPGAELVGGWFEGVAGGVAVSGRGEEAAGRGGDRSHRDPRLAGPSGSGHHRGRAE